MKSKLNPYEKAMFIAQQREPESSRYTLIYGCLFRGVSAAQVADAFHAVAAATPALRSSYALEDGEPVRIDDGNAPTAEIRDAADLDAAKAAVAKLPHQHDLSVVPVTAVVWRVADDISVLGLSVHHIAFDGTSHILFSRAMLAALSSAASDVRSVASASKPSTLNPQPSTSYKSMFPDGVPMNEMPVKGMRPKVHPLDDRELLVEWTAEEFAPVVATAKRLSCSVFEFVFSSVGAVVAKYCNSEDVVVSTQVNTRRGEEKDAVGMFVNTVAVRMNPKRDGEWTAYLKESAARIHAVTHGEQVPYSELIALASDRDASRTPVCDVNVNWYPTSPVMEQDGVSVELLRASTFESGAERKERDLTLTFTRAKTTLALSLTWSSELFDEKVIANFAAQLKATLAARPESAPYPVGRDRTPGDPLTVREALALPDDQRAALAKFSETASAELTDTLLHRMFEKAAQANPEKTALVAVDRTLTFAELDAEADRVAANLQAKGVRRGDSVVLLLPRESCYFSAMFGALKAGAAFIPCDPKYPADRINAIISDADAKFIVTTADRIGGYPEGKALEVGTLQHGGAAGVRALPEDPGVTGEDLAYMIYTSGSTGKPKGVMLRHAGICNYLRAHAANIHMDIIAREVTAYVSVTTVSFDMSFKEHCGALVNGKTLVFAGDDQMNDPEELAKLIRENQADAINATPSRLQQYFECEAFRKALGRMKLVQAGGEMYPFALRDQLKAVTKAKLYNTYGPTEITVSSNVADLTDAAYVHVGRPLLNYREWIVDRFGDLSPFGVTGELYIGGVGVAKGYRNLPEQTAARFVIYGGVPVYRSGDLAKWDDEGHVLIAGRIDSQVKLRGLRIELGEIQGLLATQPGVKNSVVLVRKLNGQENLCAYYVADRKIDPAALRDELRKSLTPYMVPTAYLQLDRFPVTPNGKTDLKSLPDAVRLVEDMSAPETECQKKIFEVVAVVIGHREFGVKTAFSSAGLSSLGVVRLSVELGKAFGIPFKIRDLLANDTVVKLEGFVATAALAALQAASAKAAAPRQKDYPITKTQMGIFIECQSNSDTTIYNIPRLLKLGAGVDVNRLVGALKATVDAHPYIKTRLFQDADGNVRAERRDESEAKVAVVSGPLPDPQSLVKPYDLLGDDLYRLAVYQTPDANYLFVEFHHIVSDGESDIIFLKDLNRAYAGEALETETFTGFEVALDEEAALKTDAFEKAKAHYDAIFAGCEPDTVPEDYAAEGQTGLGRAKRACAVSAKAVQSFCEKNGASVNAFFNAAFGFTLSRYANTTEAVYTTVYNGRNDSRTMSSMSMFVKTLPILFRRTPGQTVADAVRDMGRQIVGAMENDLFSFADIVQAYGVKADILFVYQGEGFDVDRIGGEPCERIPVELDRAKAKLQIEVGRKGDAFVISTEYDTAFYTEKFVDGLMEGVETTFAEFLKKASVGDVDLCSESCCKAMDSFFGTVVPYDRGKTVVEQFREQANARPDHPAVVHLDTTLTYREVDERSDRIAAFLNAKGIGKGDFVSILIPRCVWMTTASLGVLKSGAAYQPLDPSYPPERLEFMIADAGVKLVIADESLLDRIPGYKGEVVTLEELEKCDGSGAAGIRALPGDAFIILYTSGSTGKPKGAVLEHGNLMAFCALHRKAIGLDGASRYAAYASYGFDANMMDQYPTLTAGGTLYIIDESIRLDLTKIDEYFCANGMTHAFMTTQVGRQYAQVATAKTLKWLGVGGEALVPLEPPKGFRLFNLYGPTETTVYVTGQTVARFYRHMPIGRTVDNMRSYVVDERGRRLPPGVPGELWVSGPQVSRGYLNNPEKTAAAFGTNPFAPEGGDYARLYRTGDIVKFEPDGTIMFVGRRDGQVKVRGFRIELSEVEEVIRRFPGVKDATVAAFDNPAGGKFVAAYVVGDDKIDINALHAFIGAEKPSYMVPAVTMQIEKIPLNQNQKVNRRALPKPELKVEEHVGAEPETELEKKLCEMIAALLGIGKVYADDDFFALGGDSIRAMSFAAKAKGLGVKTAMVMKRRTPRAIAEAIEGPGKREEVRVKSEETRARSGCDVAKDAVKTPLNAFERSMFYEQLRNPASMAYCMAFGLKLDGVDADQTAEAFRKVAAAHEAMHSHYAEEKGVPMRVDDGVLPEVEIRTVSGVDEAVRDAQTLPKMNDLSVTPFKAFVYRLPGKASVLAFSGHHIAFDGTSFGVVMRELLAVLNGGELEKEVSLHELAARQPAESSSSFYDEMFADGVPVNEMPVKGSRPKEHPFEDRLMSVDWTADEYAVVAAAAKKLAVTPFELVFSAVGAVVAKYCASEDVVLGVPTNMRPDDAEDAVGMFVNTAAVRLKPSRDKAFGEYVKASAETFRTATREAMMPFAEVVSKYVKTRDPSRSPIYDVNVNWLPALYSAIRSGAVSVEIFKPFENESEVGQRSRDMSLTFMTDGRTLSMKVSWPGALFDEALIANFASQIKRTLAARPESAPYPVGRDHAPGDPLTVREALALPDAQREALERFSTVAAAEPDETLLHRMFEKAAKANPKMTALVAVDRTMTFAELDAEADAVAANLQARGVRRGDSVVLLLPRQSWFFSAMFGVLKTGAAFIPCDPKYPADRINHIIADADAKFIVTTADKTGDYPDGKTIEVSTVLRGGGKPSDSGVTGEDLAYMIYTSGSTGKPKGVMLRHVGICNYLRAHPANIHLDFIAREVSAYLSVTTVSFDMSFKEHCATLVHGKTLVFAGDDQMNDPKALADLIVRNKADAINATPSRLQQYMEYGPFREALAGMKAVLSGGEGYPIALRDQLKTVTKARIINTYGPTEITVSSNGADITDAKYVSIGRPLLNYHEWIVDRFGDLSPFGVTGELYIGGIGVAKGYRNLPEQTAARFIEYGGMSVYKSGDLARWDADGNVLIFGRIDSQVKLRGLRIELGEIQGLIAAQPGVRGAVVMVRKLNGQENLCAYYVADRKIDPSALRDELKKTLTPYMVPTAYLQLEKFPVTPNGKTDLKALPEPEALRIGEYVEPANDDERFFCRLFAEVLELKDVKVGATDSFFDIGGTSLLATSVVIDSGDAGYALAYGDIFKFPTARQLAERFGKGGAAKPAEAKQAMFDYSPYDHARYAELLKTNTIESYRHGEERPLGDILITGATGFMGIHVLAQFLAEENDKAYCLVRKGRYATAADRLRNMMFYYFGHRYDREFDTRVEVIDGDVTKPECLKPLLKRGINTVFNCAANVKHFSKGTDIEDVNVGGVKTAIAFCLRAKARLIHFSTTSVAGFTTVENGRPALTLDERTLFSGQNLDNKYTGSKMMGELEVFKAIAEQGLVAKVIRVGTLAAREEDGEFQINFLTNSFMGRLRSYALLGKFPYAFYANRVCLGPIDMSARAFLKLAKTPAECRLFHCVNNHTLPLGDIIRAMNADGIPVEFVEREEFNEALDEAAKDPKKANILAAMLAYRNMAGDSSLVPTPVMSDYTTQVLIRSGFFWNASNEVYVKAFINALKELSFFEQDNLVR